MTNNKIGAFILMNNKQDKNPLQEEKKSLKSAEGTMVKNFIAEAEKIRKLRAANSTRSIQEAVPAAWVEFNRMADLYTYTLVATSILASILWTFVQSAGKITVKAALAFASFAQKRLGLLKTARSEVDGILSGRNRLAIAGEGLLAGHIDQVVANGQAAAAGVGSARAWIQRFVTWGRAAKLAGAALGSFLWFKSPSEEEPAQASGDPSLLRIVKENAELELKNFLILEWVWAGMKIEPYLESKDPTSRNNIILFGSIGGGFLVNLLAKGRLILLTRKVPITVAKARRIVEEQLLKSIRVGSGELIRDIKKGTDAAVEEIFSTFRGADIKAIPVSLGRRSKSSNGPAGIDYLKMRIKKALNDSVESSEHTAQVIFNDLVADLNADLRDLGATTGGATTDVSRAKAIDAMVVKCYVGANKGIEDALYRVSKRQARAHRRAKQAHVEAAKDKLRNIRQELKAMDTSGAEKTAAGLFDDINDQYIQLAKFREELYTAAAKDLLIDLRAIDDDFTTYYFLSGAKSAKGHGSRVGTSQMESATDTATHFMRHGEARADLVEDFNKKIEDINAAFKSEAISAPEFKDLDVLVHGDFEKFLDDAYTSITRAADEAAAARQMRIQNPRHAREIKRLTDDASKLTGPGAEEAQAAARRAFAQYEIPRSGEKSWAALQLEFLEACSASPETHLILKRIIEKFIKEGVMVGRAAEGMPRQPWVEMTSKQKFATAAAIFGASYVGFTAYKGLTGKRYDENSPISINGGNIVEAVKDDEMLAIVVSSLVPRGKSAVGPERAFKKRVSRIGQAAQIFGDDSVLKESILRLHAEYWVKAEDGSWTVNPDKKSRDDPTRPRVDMKKAVQALKNAAALSIDNLVADPQLTALFREASAGKGARQDNITSYIKALQISLVFLAYDGPDNKTYHNKLYRFLTHRVESMRQGTDAGVDYVVAADRALKERAWEGARVQIKRLKTKYADESKKEGNSLSGGGIIDGNRLFLTKLVGEAITEYRALDNYNQYPYHSGIGTDEEPAKDFMEDWKDFELSLVRDESRETAVALAKILIKDLELFGDVMDLVGKNQSVSTEILIKMRNSQEKDK